MGFPELAVPVTGVVEIVATGSIALGVAGRLGGSVPVAGMVVAAGPQPRERSRARGPVSRFSERVRTPTGTRRSGKLVETVTTDDRPPGLAHSG